MRARSLLLGGAGAVAAVVVCWVLAMLLPVEGVRADPASRLAFGTASLLPAASVLLAMLLVQMAARFATGAFDPTLGEDSRILVLGQRVIANTVEQMMCFVPAMLALSAAIGPYRMATLLAFGLTFALARLGFWIGYLRAPLLRAPGMAATIVVNLATLAWAVWDWAG
jgi:hypothetical protein